MKLRFQGDGDSAVPKGAPGMREWAGILRPMMSWYGVGRGWGSLQSSGWRLWLLAGDVAATWGRVTRSLGRDLGVRPGTGLRS